MKPALLKTKNFESKLKRTMKEFLDQSLGDVFSEHWDCLMSEVAKDSMVNLQVSMLDSTGYVELIGPGGCLMSDINISKLTDTFITISERKAHML